MIFSSCYCCRILHYFITSDFCPSRPWRRNYSAWTFPIHRISISIIWHLIYFVYGNRNSVHRHHFLWKVVVLWWRMCVIHCILQFCMFMRRWYNRRTYITSEWMWLTWLKYVMLCTGSLYCFLSISTVLLYIRLIAIATSLVSQITKIHFSGTDDLLQSYI